MVNAVFVFSVSSQITHVTKRLRTGRFKQPLVVSLLTALNAEMARRFHMIEFNSLLSESSILDLRFKRKTF